MSGGWATGPDSTRTGRSTSRLQPAARTGGAVGSRAWQASPVQPAETRKGVPASGSPETGEDTAPTSSPRPGRTPALCLAPCCHTGPGCGLPSPGVEGAAATRCQTLPGHSHIPRRRPRPLARLSTSGRAALYVPCPIPGPPAALDMGSGGQATDAPLVRGPSPAVPRGRVPAPSPPQVAFLLKPPNKMVWGPGPSTRLPLFYLCFCLQIGMGSSREAAGLLSPRVSPGEVGSSPSAELDSTFLVTPPRTAL